MRSTFIVAAVVTVFLCSAAVACGEGGTPGRGPHVRPLTKSAAALLDVAMRQSPIVRDLVERFDRTDVVVYVTDSTTVCAPMAACLRFLVSAGGVRYLLVSIERWLVAPWDRIALLAHELQHAAEVSEAPEVTDAATLARYYHRIGWQSATSRFETGEARAVGLRVRQQLSARH